MTPRAGAALAIPPLTGAHFAAVRSVVYDVAGINLHEGKENLVRARLARRIRELGLDGFDAYLEHLSTPAGVAELPRMVDALTTNKTSFFREARHFDLLRSVVLPPLVAARQPVRIWSAGCSTGEEPYTLAMVLREVVGGGNADARILATDISARVIAAARAGCYGDDAVADVPAQLLRAYFTRQPAVPTQWSVNSTLRQMIRFARLNLMDEWPMRGPFDVIFCRNVMIYFDKPTQQQLVGRYWEMLPSGGYLFVGHSESLSGIRHGFRYVQPAVYVK